jgi:hypothetical protein
VFWVWYGSRFYEKLPFKRQNGKIYIALEFALLRKYHGKSLDCRCELASEARTKTGTELLQKIELRKIKELPELSNILRGVSL